MRIAVFCGSSRRAGARHLDLARTLGDEIARRGHELIYGGGRTGLMGAVADAALTAGGSVRGVILQAFVDHDVHHRGLAELVCVGEMRARKAGLDEAADAFVTLPGGLGTLEEVCEVLSFRKIGLHRRPVVFVDAGFWQPLLQQLATGIEARLDDPATRDYFRVTDDPREAVQLCEKPTP